MFASVQDHLACLGSGTYVSWWLWCTWVGFRLRQHVFLFTCMAIYIFNGTAVAPMLACASLCVFVSSCLCVYACLNEWVSLCVCVCAVYVYAPYYVYTCMCSCIYMHSVGAGGRLFEPNQAVARWAWRAEDVPSCVLPEQELEKWLQVDLRPVRITMALWWQCGQSCPGDGLEPVIWSLRRRSWWSFEDLGLIIRSLIMVWSLSWDLESSEAAENNKMRLPQVTWSSFWLQIFLFADKLYFALSAIALYLFRLELVIVQKTRGGSGRWNDHHFDLTFDIDLQLFRNYSCLLTKQFLILSAIFIVFLYSFQYGHYICS